MTELKQRAEKAEAENAALRAMIKEWLPVMEGYTESTHFVEGFRRKRNKWDDRLAEIKAVCKS